MEKKPNYLTLCIIFALGGCGNESIQNTNGLTNSGSSTNVESKQGIEGKGAQLEPGGYMYFFENGLPQAITSSSTTPLAITDEHFKDGSHSLKWAYSPNSQLRFHQKKSIMLMMTVKLHLIPLWPGSITSRLLTTQ